MVLPLKRLVPCGCHPDLDLCWDLAFRNPRCPLPSESRYSALPKRGPSGPELGEGNALREASRSKVPAQTCAVSMAVRVVSKLAMKNMIVYVRED